MESKPAGISHALFADAGVSTSAKWTYSPSLTPGWRIPAKEGLNLIRACDGC